MRLPSPHRQADDELRKREARYRTVLDAARDAIITITPDGTIWWFNRGAERIFGHRAEEVIGRPVTLLMPERYRELCVAGLHHYLETGEARVVGGTTELVGLRKDGGEFPIELSLGETREGKARLFTAVIRDITEKKRTEEALRRSEASLAAAQRMAHLGSWMSDLETGEMYWSDELYRILGFEARELVPSYEHFFDSVHPEDKERVENLVRESLPEGGRYDFEFRIILPDGLERIVHAQVEVVSDEAGRPTSVLGIAHDITERKNFEASLELLLREHEMVLKSAGEGILGLDMHGKVTFANPAAARMTGWNTQELLGRPLHDLLHHSKPDGTSYPSEECPIYAALEGGGAQVRDEEVFSRKDGTSFPVEYTSTPIVEHDEIAGAVVTFRNITERKTLEEQLRNQALHDSLTGLLVRTAFMDRLEQALARASRQKTKVAVLFADLDNLKVINDSLGHKAGDQLLEAVAKRLKDCLRPEDTAARIGGDEFAIFVEDLSNITDVTRIAERIAEALQPPFVIDEREVFATLSIGISLSNSVTERPENLLRYADLAMYRAKHKGKARYEIFEPSMDAKALERLRTETELRRAIALEQFRIYYQPVVALENGRIAGMEALVRWEHPERGLLLPEEFLALAEETGLIIPIGEWVLREACKQMRVWQRLYPSLTLTISVNLSTSQIFRPEMVAEVLDTTELDPSTLQLEITEGAMTNNITHSANASLGGLKNLGVQLAIDDFGMGYSSLSYLKRFPVDFLKIDRSFVGDLGRDAKSGSKDAEIVSAMIKLTHALDLKVIAEGVETAEQMACLRDLGSDFAQGNYFSEPLPAGAVSELLRDNLGNRGGSGDLSAL